MTNFIIDGITSLFNSFRQKLWPNPNEALKRRRDSVDEEDDIFDGYQTLSKRPKWNSNLNMASDNDASSCSSPRRSCIPNKRSFQLNQFNAAVKENGNGVEEVIEIKDDDQPPVESRAPLASLSVKVKGKSGQGEASCSLLSNGSLSQPAQKSSAYNTDRRKNGTHPLLFQNSFTTPLRFTKYPSVLKQTALNETLKVDDQRKYSALLSQYHMLGRPKDKVLDNQPLRKNWPVQENSLKSMAPSCSKCPPRQETRTCIRIPVKPWKMSVSDDDVQIIEEGSIPKVNSLEKKNSQNVLVSPQWIIDMQNKYGEREREARRQMEEAKLKKELYAKHHHECLEARIRKHLHITDVVLEDVEIIPKLPELTPDMNKVIDSALKPNPPNELLVEGFGQMIRRKDIKTLSDLNWLNDEVINFYMNLIVERGKESNNIKAYAFNTFFYPKLIKQGYTSLKRWTKKVDIFAHELLLVPIHLGMHWCMAAVNFKDRSVRYYDSMGSDNDRCLNALLKYLNEESLDKKKTAYDTSDWKTENVKEIPQQMNGSDCGMFSCMFAEYLSRNAKFTFSQKDMPYFRRKMVYEIISKKLLQ